jgi:hypothetical protein
MNININHSKEMSFKVMIITQSQLKMGILKGGRKIEKVIQTFTLLTMLKI